MKTFKHLSLFVLFLTLNFSLFASGDYRFAHANFSDTTISNGVFAKAQTVYICTGPYAYAYHSRTDCPGLNNCKGETRYTDETTALNSLNRRPCCRCWSNVSGNCKDDASSVGSSGGSGGRGSGGDGAAIAAGIVIFGSAIILSNDFYIYPVYSFNTQVNVDDYYSVKAGKGSGFAFGFRKTFTHSALEYGVSVLTSNVTERRYSYNYSEEMQRTGGHLNFVHQFLYNKTPERLKLYAGPSINYISDFGYGGIVGAEYNLIGRLKFDVRYEYTTQTNQIQAGLIFKYQKKYLWQK